jgi:hypothetical protein
MCRNAELEGAVRERGAYVDVRDVIAIEAETRNDFRADFVALAADGGAEMHMQLLNASIELVGEYGYAVLEDVRGYTAPAAVQLGTQSATETASSAPSSAVT